ncbi:VCBS repeat-containing protein [Streptomyces sp. NPDC046712]|uniref:VCBS repeat-containing protein n=1 Tax=Streptomyces sp. NPDC046712 TaxID=3154802 RepID=UPI0033D9E4C7
MTTGALTAAPAFAAPSAAPSGAVAGTTAEAAEAGTQNVIPLPTDAKVVGAGATGFLTRTYHDGYAEQHWTSFATGAVTDLGWSVGVQSTGSGDVVSEISQSNVRLVDMSTGTRLLDLDRRTLGDGVRYVGAAGRALFTSAPEPTTGDQGLVMRDRTADRAVTGLPQGVTAVSVRAGTSEHGLVTFTTGTGTAAKQHLGLLDLAGGAVTQTYDFPAAAANGDLTVSATHIAWVQYDANHRGTVVVLDRATGEKQTFGLGDAYAGEVEVGLVGDWVTYGERGGFANGDASPLYALTARSLTDKAKAPVKLLDHLASAADAPDGTQLVRGGTVAQGESLFRIAPGPDGTPTATVVASTGEPTKLTLTGHNIPAVIDLDANRGRVPLEWQLSRSNAEVKITLRHVRTGKTATAGVYHPETPVARYDWWGDLDTSRSAYNGAYTWEISARPLNGIGPTLVASGKFTVTRKTAPHDFDDDGTPDVLARDGSGRLWRNDSFYSPYANYGQLVEAGTTLLGSGWGGYDQIEAAGNIAGAPTGDLVARDKSGVLWHYLGKGDGTFAPRYKIGGGWGGYNKIAAGSDLTGDGKPDLVATDAAGALWLHKGTGSWRTPFTTRVKLGTGWHGYNQIVATGNIAGAPAGDLVARDKSGVLWLHLGKGDGTFAPRIKIGSGWGGYSHIVGIGDGDRDGRPDLFVDSPDGSYFYPGTGSWSAPFRGRQLSGLLFGSTRFDPIA